MISITYRRIVVDLPIPPPIDDDSDNDDDYVPKRTIGKKRKISDSDDDDDYCLDDEEFQLDGEQPGKTASLARNRPRRCAAKKAKQADNEHNEENTKVTASASAYGHLMSPLFRLPRELRDEIWGYVWTNFRINSGSGAVQAGPAWFPDSIVAVFPVEENPDVGIELGLDDPLSQLALWPDGDPRVYWVGDSDFWLHTCRQMFEEGVQEMKRQAELIVNLKPDIVEQPEFFTQPFFDVRGIRTLFVPGISINLKHLPGHSGFGQDGPRQRLIYSLIFNDKDLIDAMAQYFEDNHSITAFKVSLDISISPREQERWWFGRTVNGYDKVKAIGELDANFSPLVPMLKKLKSLNYLEVSVPDFDDVNEHCDRLENLCKAEFQDGIQQLADQVFGGGFETEVEEVEMRGNNWNSRNGLRHIFRRK
ncbi:hypothetical protein BDV96DRAFT_602876 [Lophiotrema nucula]|uniref:Uncharacterized protein n=1 Tax=Lophiotrema nucula TaxID=690887 RepID=A0A6A5YXM6_9PLEO|nr:hypothetical protein BDV96DRAFT_602876 [Lophiotrema nucula]